MASSTKLATAVTTVDEGPAGAAPGSSALPFSYWPLALLCVSHFIIDLYSIGLGTFQPYLVERLSLSLAQAGLLAGLLSLSSSTLQPLYGLLSDRFPTRHFTVLAPLVAGLGISSLGHATSFGMAIVCVVLGGAGIASFHPQASANATTGITYRRARWMAVFISSGTLGLAMGPAFFSYVTAHAGFDNAIWALLPGLIMTLVLWRYLTRFPATHARRALDFAPLKAVRGPMILHFLLVVIRSIVQISFSQLLPLYLYRERHFTVAEASLALSLYLASGAIGGFTGGQLADRFGGNRVIRISMSASLPFLLLFFLSTGWLAMLGLGLGGLLLLFTIPVNVTMAQDLVPSSSHGTVSALTMGFAWGMAGLIFVPLEGRIADATSLHVALMGTLIFPVIGFGLTWLLPPDRKQVQA